MGSTRLHDTEGLREEQRRMRYVRMLVDLTTHVIMQSRPTRREAEKLVEAMRRQILRVFPGKAATYDIVYRRRFERLIREYARGAGVLPFH